MIFSKDIIDERIKGYQDGLMAVASFLESKKNFSEWYGDGNSIPIIFWKYILIALDRENEFYILENRLKNEFYHFINKEV